MLKKLRVKFIALNMFIVVLVLALAFGAIVYLNHQQSVGAVYAGLEKALDLTDKRLSNHTPNNADDAGDTQDDATDPRDDAADTTDPRSQEDADQAITSPSNTSALEDYVHNVREGRDGMAPPEIGIQKGGEDQVLPSAICIANADGSFTLSELSTASISDEVLASAVEEALSAYENQGKLSDLGLFFAKRTTKDGAVVAFADTSAATSWQSLALTFAGVGAAALLVFLVISVFFSRWALRPVERAWTQQQQFIADASHELKTPLTVILANTAILRAHPTSTVEEQAQWVESTQTEAERMQGLVGDMLELARPRTQAAQNALLANVDLADLVESHVLQFESVAFERGILIESDLAPNVFLQGDAKRLERLVSTLIDNACKYADEGTTVTVKLSPSARDVRLCVHSLGSVIPEEDLPHVFDRFYRADKARTREAGGYGLGLAIAQDVAHEHGGSIAVTSNPNDGTTFTVTLPRVR